MKGLNPPTNGLYLVCDLQGNEFYLQTGEDRGFMVFDPVANNFIEKSADLKSPYDFSKNGNYYYFGPMNYYKREGNKFYSLINNSEILELAYMNELQNIFNEQPINFRQSFVNDDNATNKLQVVCDSNSTEVNSISDSTTKNYIYNYEYIKDAVHPSNFDGSCGFVAGALILNYWDKTMHRGTVLDQYYDENMELIDTKKVYSPSTNLKDKLVELNNGEVGSRGLTVRDALISYCKYANIAASSSYYLGNIGLDYELANNRPVIIFGALPDVQNNNNLVNHAVTCYGTQINSTGKYYVVNYGWDDEYSEVLLGFSFIGSITTFQLDETGYETSYTISPSSYGFPQEYCSQRTSKTINLKGNSIVTNRLRCGYIEDEYVNLSPRKTGFDTAYIEYEFPNPVRKIDVNLSFWSNDERYASPNVGIVTFDYKNLTSNSWINKYDLLNDGELPTDRAKQKTFTFEFPQKTKEVRIYSHFDYMYGKTDRNKGRISIGDMNIYSYK